MTADGNDKKKAAGALLATRKMLSGKKSQKKKTECSTEATGGVDSRALIE